MKHLILILTTTLFLTCAVCAKQKVEKFTVKRGTNLAHFLSQSNRRGAEREAFFVKKDIETIAEMGFDHVRLPIDEEQMWDETGKRHKDAFILMTNVLDWCAEYNLRAIVDLHILRSHHFNAAEKPLWTDPAEQEKFYDLWRDLSSVLKKYPNNMVAYELMNEAVADDPGHWNNLLTKAMTAVRKLEPERCVVIGSNKWQQVGTFDVLEVPENDPNIILSFHFYEPFLLSHWKASWTNLRQYAGPVHYPGVILSENEFEALPEEMKPAAKKWLGKIFNKEWILSEWQKPIDKAKKLGLPLYCGEFGIIKGPENADMERWYQDMIDLLEDNNIGYANWNYESGSFGLLDGKGKRRENFISIISGK